MNTTVDGARPKVLVIDDEIGPRESLRILLKNDCDVRCSDSVDAGVGLLKQDPPDIVIMDIRMPGKNGIEGLREIRAVDGAVSVVMLTGFGGLDTAQQAMRLGANDYINKPFDTAEMRQVVSRYTQRTRFERRRLGLMEELTHTNRDLLGALAEREHLAAIAQSSAEFLHDLRNPLMVVTGYVELLARQLQKSKDQVGSDYDEMSGQLDVIGQQVKRCCELAHLWQRTRRGDGGEMSPIAVSDVVRDLMLGLKPMAAGANVHAECDVDINGDMILGCRLQLLRALHNLAANAVHAVTPGAGCVVVNCRRNDDGVEITVSDNGCGMSTETIGRIFEPYFTTKKENGQGLGLAITKRIIEEHGGRITVRSVPGEGSVFSVNLPVLSDHAV